MTDTSRVDSRDIRTRLEECIGKWPRSMWPEETVEVRADLITAALTEIEKLRTRPVRFSSICGND
jgi:hypothetical protein